MRLKRFLDRNKGVNVYDFIYDTYREWENKDFHTFTEIMEYELGVKSDKVYDFYEKYAENDFDEFILRILNRAYKEMLENV